jgi:hypothetical protein
MTRLPLLEQELADMVPLAVPAWLVSYEVHEDALLLYLRLALAEREGTGLLEATRDWDAQRTMAALGELLEVGAVEEVRDGERFVLHPSRPAWLGARTQWQWSEDPWRFEGGVNGKPTGPWESEHPWQAAVP